MGWLKFTSDFWIRIHLFTKEFSRERNGLMPPSIAQSRQEENTDVLAVFLFALRTKSLHITFTVVKRGWVLPLYKSRGALRFPRSRLHNILSHSSAIISIRSQESTTFGIQNYKVAGCIKQEFVRWDSVLTDRREFRKLAITDSIGHLS